MRRAPLHLWLIAIAAFVVPMVIAFYVSGIARHAKTNVVNVEHDDPELDVAIEAARKGLPTFTKELDKPPADVISFAIKARLVQGSNAEALWVDHLSYSNGVFVGKLADSPLLLSGLHKSDEVKVPEAQVVDWLILHRGPDGDLREGGETDRVLQRRQDHTQRYPRPMPASTRRRA